jgi:hypothetical protein
VLGIDNLGRGKGIAIFRNFQNTGDWWGGVWDDLVERSRHDSLQFGHSAVVDALIHITVVLKVVNWFTKVFTFFFGTVNSGYLEYFETISNLLWCCFRPVLFHMYSQFTMEPILPPELRKTKSTGKHTPTRYSLSLDRIPIFRTDLLFENKRFSPFLVDKRGVNLFSCELFRFVVVDI